LLTGLVFSLFAELSFELGDSEFLGRLSLVYLALLISAMGTAFTLVHPRFGAANVDWQQREHYEGVVFWLLLAAFVVHAIIALTRKTRRQFIILSVIQLVVLASTVPCVLYFYHYEATHGHG
jgi:ascorbate-specific PTS system EIIC-type component UlaA